MYRDIFDKVKDYIDANYRQRLRITFPFTYNDEEHSAYITEADIVQGSFVIDKSSVSGNSLELGATLSSQVSFTFNNSEGFISIDDNEDTIETKRVTFAGAEMLVEWGINRTAEGDPLYFPLGYFTISDNPKMRSTIKVTGYDRMVWFDREVNWDIFPYSSMSVYSILSAICSTLAIDYSPITDWDNSNYTVDMESVKESMSEGDTCSYRDLLRYIGEIIGAVAVIDETGKLVYKWYKTTDPKVITIDSSVRFKGDNDSPITITGVSLNSEYLEGSDQYAMLIEDNPLITDAEAFANGDSYGNKALYNIYVDSIINSDLPPDTYQRLEYVNTGGAYIDTGESSFNKAVFDVRFTSNSANNRYLFGCDSISGQGRISLNLASSLYNYKSLLSLSNNAYPADSYSGLTDTDRHSWEVILTSDIDSGLVEVYLDGNVIISSVADTFLSGGTIALFALHNTQQDTYTNTANMNVYEVKLLAYGSELLKHYIPCKRLSDDAVGFYETVSGEFITDELFTGSDEYIEKDFTYTPMSCEILSAPYIEPLDIIWYTDYDGNTVKTCVTGVTHRLNASSTIESAGESQEERNYVQLGRKTRENAILRKIKSSVDVSLNNRIEAVLRMNNLIQNAMGLYPFSEDDGNGGKIYYMTSIPDVSSVDEITSYYSGVDEDTKSVTYVFGSNGFAWSKGKAQWEGSNRWQYSVDGDGNAILSTIFARGINVGDETNQFNTEIRPDSFIIKKTVSDGETSDNIFILGLLADGRSQINKLKIINNNSEDSTVSEESDDPAYIEIGSVRMLPAFNVSEGKKIGMDIYFNEE